MFMVCVKQSKDQECRYIQCLQGKEVDRLILYRIPRGGIPEEGIEEGTVIAARVPILEPKTPGEDFG